MLKSALFGIDRLNPMSKYESKLLHCSQKAISEFNMVQKGDRVLVCVSGGKDSYSMLKVLHLLKQARKIDCELHAYTLDQSQPGWDDSKMRNWMSEHGYSHEIETRNTYGVVKEKIPAGKTYCSLCSRLRRGNIYRYARDNGFNKVALGHHRDDLTSTLLMSILYSGQIRSMPPKLLSDDKKTIVIRPLAYCQEIDIIQYASEQKFPIIPCNLCGSQQNLARVKVKRLLATLAAENPKVPSNILHALSSIKPSQLMDQELWDFKGLEQGLELPEIA